MRRVVLLDLHEKVNITGLGEIDELEKIDIQSLKSLFDLPLHTPTPAVLFTFGTMYTKMRVDQKQLIYLHRILQREKTNWTRMTLEKLENLNIGWYKNIRSTLENYNLCTNFHTIKNMSSNEWKNDIKAKIENKNTERLKQDCQKTHQEAIVTKPKTKSIFEEISTQLYRRQPRPEIKNCTKNETKTMIIARYGMLECGRNFKGTLKETCDLCNCIDDENHRLNYCPKWKDRNLHDKDMKIDFNNVYSNDTDVLRDILKVISTVWNTYNAHGTMYTG